MKFQIRQIDMMGRQSLYYLEHLDAFQIMETKIMDRVMQEYWQSNLDASGSLFGASTAYGILMHEDGEFYHLDYERRNRFYVTRPKKTSGDLSSHPHTLNFMVIRRSMRTRYFMEMAFFFCLALAFQIAIFSMNDSYL